MYRAKDIINKFKFNKYVGDLEAVFEKPSSIYENEKNCICWIKSSNIKIKDFAEGIYIVPMDFKIPEKEDIKDKFFIFSYKPKLTFIKIVNQFFFEEFKKFIHPSAIISKNAIIDKEVYIDSNVRIMDNVKIGKRVKIHPNVVIYPNVVIEDNVEIHANSVIGKSGFGYEFQNKIPIKFPHFGKVIIKKGVEIGANVCIDKGSLSNTIVGSNVKIDNLVHIAHNVVVEKNSLIIANAMIAGSVKIGQNVWIAPSSSIMNQISIGSDAIIGMGSVVIKNVNEKETVAGVPAIPIKKFKKLQSFFKKIILGQ